MLLGLPETKAHALVRKQWAVEGADADRKWKTALYEGFVEGSAAAAKPVSANIAAVLPQIQAALPQAQSGIEVVFYPGHSTWDGRYANNAWLQEAPDPMTKVVWDNAALHQRCHRPQALRRDRRRSQHPSRFKSKLRCPRWFSPASPTIPIIADPRLRPLRTAAASASASDIASSLSAPPPPSTSQPHSVSKTGDTYKLVTTQEHHTLDEPLTGKTRPIVREATLAEYKHHPDVIEHQVHEPEPVNMFPDFDYSKGYQWGMAIDLNACIGCNACLRRLPGREQHSGRRQGPGAARPRNALDPHRPLLHRRRGRSAGGRCSRWPASSARTRRAKASARWPPPSHSPKASTTWPTTAASARATAPTTARTRCAASTSSNWHKDMPEVAQDGVQSRRHRAHARRHGEVHLLRAAHPGRRRSRPRPTTAAQSEGRRSGDAPASRPARPRRSSSATSTIPTAASRS